MRNIGQIHKAAAKGDKSLISHVLIERVENAEPIIKPTRRKSRGKAKAGLETLKATGRAIATDGYILAIRNVELEETDVPGLIPGASLTQGKYTTKVELELGAESVAVRSPRWGFSKVYRRPEELPEKYPEYNKVIKQADDAIEKNGCVRVGINAAFLYRLYESLASDDFHPAYLDNFVLELTIPMPREKGAPVLDPIRVKGAQGEGLIMPVRI